MLAALVFAKIRVGRPVLASYERSTSERETRITVEKSQRTPTDYATADVQGWGRKNYRGGKQLTYFCFLSSQQFSETFVLP